MTEAIEHPHNKTRGTFVEVAGLAQPAPAPRFSRSRAEIQGPPAQAGQHTDEALRDRGVADTRLGELRAAGAIA
jgi:alpha-methylacyl-CoA racemase